MGESKEFYYVRWYKWDSEKQDYNVCESTYHYDTFEEAKKHYDKLVCNSDKPQIEIHKEIISGTDWRWGECVEDRRVLMKESMAYGVEETVNGLIRCKDCDSWDEEYSSGRKSLGNYRCVCHEWSDEEDGHYRYTAEDDFCSYAERREE